MKKTGILNRDISLVIAEMGHMDKLTICDAGLPIPQEVERIDLAVKPGLPGFLEVVRTVANDLQVEKIILAEEIKTENAPILQELEAIFAGTEIIYISHEDFKRMSADSRAIVRTGECTPYANVIMVSGVIF